MLEDQGFVQDQQVAQQQVVQQQVTRPAWSPAQAVALVIGLLYVVLAGVAMARAGLTFQPIRHVTVAGLDHTIWLAVIELLFGLVVLAVGAMPGADRGGMVFAGIVAIAGGLIIAIEPLSFHRVLGVHQGNGLLFLLAGIVLLVTAMVAPVILSRRRVGTHVAEQRIDTLR